MISHGCSCYLFVCSVWGVSAFSLFNLRWISVFVLFVVPLFALVNLFAGVSADLLVYSFRGGSVLIFSVRSFISVYYVVHLFVPDWFDRAIYF